MRVPFVVLLALLLLGATTVHASPLFELTTGFGGMGGLQPRHTGPSAASSYFNPALLTDAKPGVTFGALVLHTNIGVSVGARSPENAVPDGLVNATHADGMRFGSYPVATDFLQNGRPADPLNPALRARPRQHAGTGTETYTYEAIGLVVKLFKERLALGFYGLVPNRNFATMRSFYVDEREQYFSNSLHPEMYGDRLTAVSVAFGAGVRLTNSLSLGFGATLGLWAKANAPVFVADAGRLNDLQLNTDVSARITLVPHVGVAWNPGKRWHLTATAHAPQKLDVVAEFQFLLSNVEQGSGMAFTYYYQPWQASAGLGYDFYVDGDTTFTASTALHYQRWSKYIDRQSMRPERAYTWEDTLTGAAGVRMQQGALSLALDGQYKPTPVPEQTGRSNYVDNDRFGLSFSMEYGFTLWDSAMKVGGQLQTYRLIQRGVKKFAPPTNAQGVNRTPQLVADEVPDDAVVGDRPVAGREGLQTNNPGWPGFTSVGWVTSAGLYISVAL